MGLLDLPIELLRPIVRDVVLRPSDCNNQKCNPGGRRWTNSDVISLARVNTVLEWEVFLLLEHHFFLVTNSSRPSSSFDLHPEYAAFIARYVTIRPYQAGARWNDHFPALVNEIVDTIIRLNPRSAAQRPRMIAALCHKASLHLLVSKTIGEISRSDFNEHLLVAATHLKQLPVLADLLSADGNLSRTHSDFFGTPVQAAIAADDPNLVRRFLLHGAAFEYPGWLTDVVQAPTATRLLAVFATHQQGQTVLRTSIRDVTAAVHRAVALGREDAASHLLATQREAFGHGSLGYYLRGALLAACTRGMTALVALLLEAGGYAQGGRWTGPNLRLLMTATCTAGRAATLRVLLARTKDLKNAVPASELLVDAAKTGSLAGVRVLLDTGARLSGVAAMKLLAGVAPWPPKEEDEEESPCAVLQRTRYLLERKAVRLADLLAVEEHTGFGAAHCMMVAAQRGNFELLEALARFGVPVDDVEFYARAGCAVPIVAAGAYGREETVRKVKALVVELQLQRCGEVRGTTLS